MNILTEYKVLWDIPSKNAMSRTGGAFHHSSPTNQPG
jgi:hypothetical protein